MTLDGRPAHLGLCVISSFMDCFELLRLACGRCARARIDGYSVVGVDFPSRELGNLMPGSESADRGSPSSYSSSSVIVGKCSESSSEFSELLSPFGRFGRVLVLSDFADDGWSGYSHSRLPFRQPR